MNKKTKLKSNKMKFVIRISQSTVFFKSSTFQSAHLLLGLFDTTTTT